MSGRKNFLSFLRPWIDDGRQETVPEFGAALFWYVFLDNFPKLIVINFISVILSIPIITLPASIAASGKILMKLTNGGCSDLFSEYFIEWRSSAIRYTPFFLISASAAALPIMVAISALDGGSALSVYASLTASAVLCCFVFVLWCYAFSMFSYLDLPQLTIIKNSAILSVICLKENAKLLLVFLSLVILAVLYPYSIPVPFLFLVPVQGLAVACIIKKPIRKYITNIEEE